MGSAFVLVDGMSVVRPDGLIDSKAIDFKKLKDALKPYSGKGNTLFVLAYFQSDEPLRDGAQVLMWTLEGFGRRAGFDKTRPIQTWFNKGFDKEGRLVEFDWKKQTAKVDDGAADMDEPAVGNDLVKVYPVRTALSRQLTNADCVVDIRAPLITQGDGLKAETRQAIRRFVNEIKLPRKEYVLFRINRSLSGEEAYERFLKNSEALGTWLGFKGSGVQG
jgi:hypothetical protein